MPPLKSSSLVSKFLVIYLLAVVCAPLSARAQQPASAPAKAANGSPAEPAVPGDYTIGPEDVLNIVFWREADISAEVVVRPDGKISLPLINEIAAAGLTPAQLRDALIAQAKRFVADPNVTVIVRQINSRKVFITGNVERPGPYPLGGGMTVLQLIALSGGLREFADSKKIVITRTENGKSVSLPFNYNDVSKGKKLNQNIQLKPGDTVIVP